MKSPDEMKISIVGDLMCLKEQNHAIRDLGFKQEHYNEIFKYVRPLFEDSDFLIGNLETPVCSSALSEESINFNTPVEFVRALKNCGFNFVSTANNHCLDRGLNGLIETIDNLDNENLLHSGTYKTEKVSNEISIINVKNTKVAIVCCTFGTNSEVNGELLPEDQLWRIDLLKKQNKPSRAKFNPHSDSGHKMIADNVTSAAISNSMNQRYVERLLSKIERAKQQADVVIVMPHIGGQYNPYPGNYTLYIVDTIATLQPSIIIAGHPHVPQYCAIIKDIPTAFSLGNFSFTPEVGYYIGNSLAEYGVVLHTYWKNACLERMTYSIIKNVVGEDHISRVIPVNILFDQLKSPLEKERLQIEVQAVANRVSSTFIRNPFESEIILGNLPNC